MEKENVNIAEDISSEEKEIQVVHALKTVMVNGVWIKQGSTYILKKNNSAKGYVLEGFFQGMCHNQIVWIDTNDATLCIMKHFSVYDVPEDCIHCKYNTFKDDYSRCDSDYLDEDGNITCCRGG